MARDIRSNYHLGLVDETKKGADSARRNLGLIENSANKLKASLAGLVGGLSLAGVAGGLKSIVDLGDDFRDLSKQLAGTVEQISGLDFIGRQSGTSVDALANASAKLNKNLLASAKGGGKEFSEALRSIGLNSKELLQLDFPTQLGRIADGLKGIENPTIRAATAQAIFGRGSRQLASLLSEGSAGIDKMYDSLARVNGIITTEQGDKFDELNDSIGLLKASATGAGAALAEELAPGLTKFFNAIAAGIPTVVPFTEYLTKRFGIGISNLQLKIAEIELATAKGRQSIASKMGFVDDKRVKAAEENLERIKEAIKSGESDLDKFFEDQVKKYEANLKSLKSGTVSGDGEDVGSADVDKEAQKRIDAQKQYLDALRQQFIVIDDTSQRAKVYADTLLGSAKDFSQETKDQALAMADGLDFLKESSEVHDYLLDVAKERKQVDEQITAQYEKERAAIIENLQTPLEKYISTIEKLRTFNLSDDTFQRGVRKANEELVNAQKNTEKTTDLARELGLTFTSAFEDAVIEMRNFGDVFKGLIQDISRALLRKSITEPLTNMISGLFSGGGMGGAGAGGGGAGGGGFGQILSGLGTWLGGMFANSRGGLYRVTGGGGGERPVAFTARDGEYVAVGTSMEGGGGAQQINIYQGSEPVRTKSRNDGRVLDIMIGNSFGTNVEGGRMMPYGIKPALTSR